MTLRKGRYKANIHIYILKYSNMNVYEETANLYTPNNHIN